MKLSSLFSPILLLALCLPARAETEEHLSKRFAVKPGGKLVMDVDFGSIDVKTNATGEVAVEVVRKVTRLTKADEEEFLAVRPVTFTPEGNTVTIYSRARNKSTGSSRGKQRTEASYTITVPAHFSAQLKTDGGGVSLTDLTGEITVSTSGGGLNFTRLRGPVDGRTAGGSIRVVDGEGAQQVKTSGGGIDVSGGAGSFEGSTSGGTVVVKDFRGPVDLKTGGGGISVENVTGKVRGQTAGGNISARFTSPLAAEVRLKTSGGSVTLRVPEGFACDLDASASGGSVTSDLPSTLTGQPSNRHLKGPVNGGGKPVVLRTSGGSIQVRKL